MQKLLKFCERLSELMLYANDISTDKLGEILGTSGALVRMWRLGKNLPSLSNIVKLANFFNCSIDYLIGRSDIELEFTPQPLILPFGKRLTSILNERGITWYKVVKNTKIANSNLSDWRGNSEPLIPILIVLADYLDVSIDYLVGRDRSQILPKA